jgi:uncharacterized protein
MRAADERYLPADLPIPEITEYSRAFLTSGDLALQTCIACAAVQHPPAELCFDCGGLDFDYQPTEPVGRICTYTVVHHVTHTALRDSVPYNVVIVELDHHPGIRIVGNLVDSEPEDLEIGTPVRGSWTKPLTAEGQEPIRLLQWRPVRAQATRMHEGTS